MNRPAVPVLLWGVLLGVLAFVLWLWTPANLPPALFGGSALLICLIALLVFWRDRPPPAVRAVPDLSVSSALVAIACALLLLGALVGLWLVLIGAGALLLGLFGVARELVAERRLR